MSQDYRTMWKDLGLDLAAHDALLNVLGKGYQDIYLAQKDRPEGMGYFDFVMSEVHGLRIKELMDEKTAGKKVCLCRKRSCGLRMRPWWVSVPARISRPKRWKGYCHASPVL